MIITKTQFKRLRASVAAMQEYNFMKYAAGNNAFAGYVCDMFGLTPYHWLVKQGIPNITLKDYRDYCVRWLDHIEKDVCK